MKQSLAGAIALLLAVSASADTGPVWREAFGSSPASFEPLTTDLIEAIAKQSNSSPADLRKSIEARPLSGTLRYRVTVTASGSQIRLRLSNEQGRGPLRISAASVALAEKGFSAQRGSVHSLSFGGSPSVTIPPGAPILSDPVTMSVASGSELLVSAALATPLLNDPLGGASFIAAKGDQSARETMDRPQAMSGRPLVTAVEVLAASPLCVIVAFGDSITDGNRSDPETLRGWPEQLARRLREAGKSTYSVVNAGIGGNRLLARGWGDAGLARLDGDALRIEGLSHILLLEGLNDIGMSGAGPFGTARELEAAELIAGYRQVIARAHVRGAKVYIGTLTPAGGSSFYSSPHKDRVREQVNAWIRCSREADAVIDFDLMLRDSDSPGRLASPYDSGDHLHPSDAGYRAMGDGIDLALFP